MAANPPLTPADRRKPWLSLTRTRLTLLVALVAIFVLCIAFSWTTRDAMSNLSFLKGNREQAGAGAQKTIVDLSPWQTAQALTALAVTAEEREYAREAERLADHEVEQAFASALREAAIKPPVMSSAAAAISDRIRQLEEIVKTDQARVDSLTAAAGKPAPKTGEDQASPGADELSLAKAQLGLDQDELTDAREELARATGDQRPRIQQELASHEAAMSKYDAQAHEQA